MKKGIVAILIACLLMGIVYSACAGQASRTYVNNGGTKTVFSDPSYGARVIGTLSAGQSCEVLQYQFEFAKVAYDGSSGSAVGWVEASGIEIGGGYSPTAMPTYKTLPGFTSAPQPPHGGGENAGQAYYGTAIVDGRNADRVHLRELPSTKAKSLGLYFTGTEVVCESDPYEDWVIVTIGRQSGHMKSEFLFTGTGTILSKQPAAVVKANKAINLYQEPSTIAAIDGTCYNGDVVTVLGETSDHWCYIYTGTQYGYVKSSNLTIQ